MTEKMNQKFKSGYVGLVGLPNVGKSTLINNMIGEKLAAVTHKPQTTRHRILGILNRPQAQILFLDTPGIHQSKKLLNEKIIQTAFDVIEEADLVLHLIFPKKLKPEDQEIAERVLKLKKKYFVLVNRIDEIPKDSLLPFLADIQKTLQPQELIPISALKNQGVSTLIEQIEKNLEEGPRYYDEEIYTDQSMRFLCEEIAREKAMLWLHQEIPYALTVQTEKFDETQNLIRLNLAIIVEKDSQKAMVIGKAGARIKKIGQVSRQEMEKMLGKKVYLELFVKVVPGWTKNEKRLRDLGI